MLVFLVSCVVVIGLGRWCSVFISCISWLDCVILLFFVSSFGVRFGL